MMIISFIYNLFFHIFIGKCVYVLFSLIKQVITYNTICVTFQMIPKLLHIQQLPYFLIIFL